MPFISNTFLISSDAWRCIISSLSLRSEVTRFSTNWTLVTWILDRLDNKIEKFTESGTDQFVSYEKLTYSRNCNNSLSLYYNHGSNILTICLTFVPTRKRIQHLLRGMISPLFNCIMASRKNRFVLWMIYSTSMQTFHNFL